MAHSLEVRVPFLDKDVWTLAAGLPKEAKIADGTTKDIFRKAVSKYIPQHTDGRKKLGFPCGLRQDDFFCSHQKARIFSIHFSERTSTAADQNSCFPDNTFFYKESSERQLQSN